MRSPKHQKHLSFAAFLLSMPVVQPQQGLPCPIRYERHQPEKTLLYKIINQNYATFLQRTETIGGLPSFVKEEFESYLKCGILAHGFLRAKCQTCSHEKLVAFSCKKRGFCPSCGAKRMIETAAHLVDHVFPLKPIRQWVISFPFQL